MNAWLDALCVRLAKRMPRRLAYFAGVRILDEVSRRPELSRASRQVHQGELRMLHALQTFVNARR